MLVFLLTKVALSAAEEAETVSSTWWFFFIDLLALAVPVLLCLRYYLPKGKQPFYHPFFVGLGWYLSMAVIFFVPIDIAGTAYRDCLNISSTSVDSLDGGFAWDASTLFPSKTPVIHYHYPKDGQSSSTPASVSSSSSSSYVSSSSSTLSVSSSSSSVESSSSQLSSSSMTSSSSSSSSPSSSSSSFSSSSSSSLPASSSSSVPTPPSPSPEPSSSSSSIPSKCSKPFVYLPDTALVIIWNVMYWFTFVMCWAVYPFLENYSVSGYFTRCERAKESLKSNALFYGVAGGLGVVGYAILLLVGQAEMINPVPVLMSLGNAWGLLLLLLLLGYGLVEIPRLLWRSAKYSSRLDRCRFEIVGVSKKLADTREKFHESLQVLKKYTEKADDHDPYREFIDAIVAEVPAEEFQKVRVGSGKAEMFYDDIVALRYKLQNRLHEVHINEDEYDRLVQEAFDIESIMRAKYGDEQITGSLFSRYFVGIRWSIRSSERSKAKRRGWFIRAIQWIWYVYLRQISFAAAAILMALFSLVVVWCECFFFFDDPTLSIFAYIFRTGQPDAPQMFSYLSNDIVMSLLLTVPLLFIMFCSYWSLFKIKLFTYYRLLPHRSDPYSLQFSAAYLSRLAAPLTLNFLHMCKFNGSSFQKVMSSMEDMPFLGDTSFNYYAPIILVLLCIIEIFNVIPRLLNCLHIKRSFLYSESSTASESVSTRIEEGRKILEAEREKWFTLNVHGDKEPQPSEENIAFDDNDQASATLYV